MQSERSRDTVQAISNPADYPQSYLRLRCASFFVGSIKSLIDWLQQPLHVLWVTRVNELAYLSRSVPLSHLGSLIPRLWSPPSSAVAQCSTRSVCTPPSCPLSALKPTERNTQLIFGTPSPDPSGDPGSSPSGPPDINCEINQPSSHDHIFRNLPQNKYLSSASLKQTTPCLSSPHLLHKRTFEYPYALACEVLLTSWSKTIFMSITLI